jgi:putative tryptophan/tyrosine transport system substrate-binding protein
MKRRNFIALVGGAAGYAFLRPDVARTETVGPKPRIGMLWHAGSAEEEAVYLAAFRQGLADFGYVEGKNIVVEHRFPAEKPERFQSMATELVGLKMDVLVAAGQPPALALQRATETIPIVFVAGVRPHRSRTCKQSCAAKRKHHRIIPSRSDRETARTIPAGLSQIFRV